ncbi:jacalin-like lectin [Paenibacillus xylanexedens]|uniref:Endonuclease/exonuclease/phosphatase family metal-dependent hydrolase n=1 Tax=Paenibacillus xylanexedens TaxID=528191 RepID=A0ABS4RM27_PAEXY|nr:jacalin-like lectin [Paenibacillus xylanexedens]MBP2243958.1 endonuclease/exonuclease/phosphatase family metal-dependent hydrolase [Paenibacillus xylanexedens]
MRRSIVKKGAALVLSAVVAFTSSPLFLSTASAAEGGSVSGSFNVLSYNVGGLPDLVSSSNPKEYTVQISPKLNDYDIINVQEDFNYHNELISQVTLPYLTTTSGIAGFGSGLNSLSKYPFRDLKRITWDKRSGVFDNGSDELTPKGFTAATYEITPQVKVDVYNLHADAGRDDKSLEARRDNIRQLSNYIKEHSDGNAVIVFGDTNTRYTRAADNIELLMSENGLSDPWIDLIRGGSIPADGEALMDATNLNGPNYEIVDKILYRGSKALSLNAQSYRLENQTFVDPSGKQLSDHYPITAEFVYSTSSQYQLSSTIGGSGGTGFNDLNQIPDARPSSVALNSGNRVDGISTLYRDGTNLAHGGQSNITTLNLAEGEYLTQATISQGTRNGDKRIFYVELSTNLGNKIEGGQKTSDQIKLEAPVGWYIAGFYGRAGQELDQLGAIYRPLN